MKNEKPDLNVKRNWVIPTYIHIYINTSHIHIYIYTFPRNETMGPRVKISLLLVLWLYIYIYIYNHGTKCKEIFTLGPMVSFRGARKLGSYLVRAKLYPIERSLGSFKCNGKRCQVCLNVSETKTFSSTVTKKEYIINHKFNGNDKCLNV